MQIQALRAFENALGPEHLNVGIACNVLALCMLDQVTLDRTFVAEPLLAQA